MNNFGQNNNNNINNNFHQGMNNNNFNNNNGFNNNNNGFNNNNNNFNNNNNGFNNNNNGFNNNNNNFIQGINNNMNNQNNNNFNQNIMNNNMNNNMNSPNNNNMQMNNNMLNKGEYKRKRHNPDKNMSIVLTVVQDLGLDKNEVNLIKNIVQQCYSSIDKKNFLSDYISFALKKKLKGEWFVFVCNANEEFSLGISVIPDTGYLILKLGNSKIQIARIK